jgi:hypothetical protein
LEGNYQSDSLLHLRWLPYRQDSFGYNFVCGWNWFILLQR